jgi:hypothetical protein
MCPGAGTCSSGAFKNEYEFSPMPADQVSPLASNPMLHLFDYPSRSLPNESMMFRWIPQTLRSRLVRPLGHDAGPVMGWGILIVDIRRVQWASVLHLCFPSTGGCVLMCGLVYSVVRGDVHGGFAAAGALFAFSAFVGGFLHTKATA